MFSIVSSGKSPQSASTLSFLMHEFPKILINGNCHYNDIKNDEILAELEQRYPIPDQLNAITDENE